MMQALLASVPILPLAAFAVLALLGRGLTGRWVTALGIGPVGVAALIVIALGIQLGTALPQGEVLLTPLWDWFVFEGVRVAFSLRLDALSLVMAFVITFVGFWILLYSAFYMAGEEGLARYFAYMNLFVAAMLVLVLADNLLLLYLGWEGVGLCSYLLIGFRYRDPANGAAARKAFVMTRVGDTAMLIGIIFLFVHFGTLQITALAVQVAEQWPAGSALATTAALLLLGGAVGKSAQLPLQTWLPDAMAGPTPVSALIHAATMVTAGVYLIARTHFLFERAPAVQDLVTGIGGATMLLGAFAALVQRDIKRVLAYSTMSQVGLMFLALGVGAWSAAIFHLFTHAFFKALLFLSAGTVIVALGHRQDMLAMGGLRRALPAAFWGFLAGGAALAALPLVTSAFFSKEWILWQAAAGDRGSLWLWAAGWLGAFLTALYISRAFVLVFLGPERPRVERQPTAGAKTALVVLGVGSVVAGWLETPAALGGISLFRDWLDPVLPRLRAEADLASEMLLSLLAAAASLGGLALGFRLYGPRQLSGRREQALDGRGAVRLLRRGGGFDALYGRALVRPFRALARSLRADPVDRGVDAVAGLSIRLHRAMAATQDGRLRRYAGGVAAGSLVAIALVFAL